jgi:hypothetical protein
MFWDEKQTFSGRPYAAKIQFDTKSNLTKSVIFDKNAALRQFFGPQKWKWNFPPPSFLGPKKKPTFDVKIKLDVKALKSCVSSKKAFFQMSALPYAI